MNNKNVALHEIKMNGESNIELKTLNSLFTTIEIALDNLSPNYEPLEAKILPFKEGSFRVILEVLSHPLVMTSIGAVISSYITVKITLASKGRDYKLVKNKEHPETYDVIHSDGTITPQVSRDVVTFLKDKKFEKQSNIFLKNYLKNRENLELINNETNRKIHLDKINLKTLQKPVNINTIEELEHKIDVWVEVIAWGYETNKWILKPLKKIDLTNSIAKFEASIEDLSILNRFIIDDNTQIASKFIELELVIRYQFDNFKNIIVGKQIYIISKIINVLSDNDNTLL